MEIKPERFKASFQASILYALEPIVREQDEGRFAIGGVFVEPVPTGGVVVAATTGKLLAAIFDASGHCSKARRLTIPDSIFKASAPAPVCSAIYEGEVIEREAPDWMQPGVVMISEAGPIVFPQGTYPKDKPKNGHCLGMVIAGPTGEKPARGEFCIHEDKQLINWRAALKRAETKTGPTIGLDPRLLAPFGRICDQRAKSNNSIVFRFGGPDDPILLRIDHAHDFIGAVMPMRTDTTDFDLPAWLTAKAAEAVAA